MLERVRRQLVQRQRQRLRELGQHPSRLAVDPDVVLGARQKRASSTSVTSSRRSAPAQAPRASRACACDIAWMRPSSACTKESTEARAVTGEMGDRRDVAQDVFDAMVQFGHQQALALLRLLALGDVEHGADDAPAGARPWPLVRHGLAPVQQPAHARHPAAQS